MVLLVLTHVSHTCECRVEDLVVMVKVRVIRELQGMHYVRESSQVQLCKMCVCACTWEKKGEKREVGEWAAVICSPCVAHKCVCMWMCGRGVGALWGEHLDIFFLVCCGFCHCSPESVSVCVLVFYWFSVSGFCTLLLLVAFSVFSNAEIIPGCSQGQTAVPCCSRWRLRCHT